MAIPPRCYHRRPPSGRAGLCWHRDEEEFIEVTPQLHDYFSYWNTGTHTIFLGCQDYCKCRRSLRKVIPLAKQTFSDVMNVLLICLNLRTLFSDIKARFAIECLATMTVHRGAKCSNDFYTYLMSSKSSMEQHGHFLDKTSQLSKNHRVFQLRIWIHSRFQTAGRGCFPRGRHCAGWQHSWPLIFSFVIAWHWL